MVGVADVEAAENIQGILEAALGKFLEAERVVAEGEVELGAEAAGDGSAQRADDREELAVAESEREWRQVDGDQRERPAEECADDLRRILEEGEIDEVGDGLNHARIDFAEKSGDVEQGNGLTSQIADDRDRRGEDIDKRLERIGDILDALDERLEEVGEE